MDVGEFPLSLGNYSTLWRSNRGKATNRTKYLYLDKVHVDIGFGDTIAVRGARYCLLSVDQATRYNWVSTLKTLSATGICDASKLFCAQAGRFVTYCKSPNPRAAKPVLF